MAGWTEESLRSAAAWKAFKEGKSLFEAGAVTDLATTATGWRGAVQLGKRPIRVSVTAVSPTHLEVRCPCPENQSTGAVCCHAVATGLAVIHGTRATAIRSPQPDAAPQPTTPVRAFRIHLPTNWLESLKRERLTATVTASKSRSPELADQDLDQWLARTGTRFQDPLHLHLDTQRIAEFLQVVTNHPEIWVSKTETRVSVAQGARLAVRSASLTDDPIRLTPETPADTWLNLPRTHWMITPESIQRAGQSTLPASLERIFSRLSQGESVDCPSRLLLENLIPWQEWIEIPTDDALANLHFIPDHAKFHLSLDGSFQEISAKLTVTYADHPPVTPGMDEVTHLPRVEGSHCWVRDFPSELAAVRTLQSTGFATTNPSTPWKLAGEEPVTQFLAHILPSLRETWSILESARFSSLRHQVSVVSPQIQILGSGEDWLSFNLSFESSDGSSHSIEEIRKMLRSGNSRNRTPSGKRLVIDEQTMAVIDPLLAELDLRQVSGHFEVNQRPGHLIHEIRKYLHNGLASNLLEDSIPFQKPASLHAEMRPYQQHGSAWLLDRVHTFGGALLADDMGLGKTLQTIALIEQLFSNPKHPDRTILVVATTTLLGNWRAEFGKFAPSRKVVTLHGSGRDRQRERVQGGDVILTSYGTLARDLAWHLKQDYLAVVIDEASLMRNPDTDHAKAICKLRSPHRIALTGTPVENSVRDLWSLFRFIQPGWLGSREEFRDRYELPLQADDHSSASTVMERLRLKTRPFLLRRTKEQVAPELPSKIVIDEFCELSADQQAIYKDLLIEGRKRVDALHETKNSGAARMQILTALLRLRQTCCDLALLGNERLKQLPAARRSGKIERLLELLEEALANGHKVLIFSQFQQQLIELEQLIQAHGWANLRLDGQTRNRQSLVDRFQADDGPPIFLISLKAGGYGLNLTAADVVIHFDPWWNPAAEAQATDRAHRIGQTRPVTVYRLLTRGTVEEKVVRLQARKRDLAAGIDESGGGDMPSWALDDLASVIRD